jgi:hypothetical protein
MVAAGRGLARDKMKVLWWYVISALLVGALVAGRHGVGAPPKADVFKQAAQWATSTFDLTPWPCQEIGAPVSNTRKCYVTKISDQEFTKRAKADGRLRDVTGWRDDYGLLNGVFAFDGIQAYELALGYNRLTSAKDLDEVMAHAYRKGYTALVSVGLFDHR